MTTFTKERRWYCGENWDRFKDQSVVQVERHLKPLPGRGRPKIPAEIHRRAAVEYNRQGHNQTHEQLQARGGLGVCEILCLLMDALSRETKS